MIRIIFFAFYIMLCSFPAETADRILLADSLYQNNNYSAALNEFLYAISEENDINRDFHVNFKIAYCYYKTSNHEHAERRFNLLHNFNHQMNEYIDYYKFRISADTDSLEEVRNKGHDFIDKYSDHVLADSVKYHLANYQFNNANYRSAYSLYIQLNKSKKVKFSKSELLYKIAFCKYQLNYKTDSIDWFHRLMGKYPSSTEAWKAANLFDKMNLITHDNFFKIIDVYIKRKEFSITTERLEELIKSSLKKDEKDKARFYLVKVYFEKKEYQSALMGFQNIFSEINNEYLKSQSLLYIARCYLRLDLKQESAETYRRYSELFPRRRLAPETAWKAAWILEELNDLQGALSIYNIIPKRWSRSNFNEEAWFREGYTYLRLGYYNSAIEVFNTIISSRWPNWHISRAKYWKAKTLELQGNLEQADLIYSELGKKVFHDYYSMRSYLREKSKFDTLLHIHTRLSSRNNPLDGYQQFLPSYLNKFRKYFLIKELLGMEMVRIELKNRPVKPSSQGEWIALAEIYKKLGLYDKSFKIYDFIDYKYYPEYKELDKPFLLKEKYPLYFDDLIQNNSDLYNVNINFLLAVIREESAFDKWAHSWADAYGLMQLIPRTAKNLAQTTKVNYSGPVELFDEELNLKLGTYYLKSLLDQFNHKKEKALAAYNAGPHRVNRWAKYKNSENMDFFIENIEFSQTRHYVRRVMRNYWIYQLLHEI